MPGSERADGHEESREMRGYVYCACNNCMDIAIGEEGSYCEDCEAAGCPDYQGIEGMSQECQRDDWDEETDDDT